jgi:carbon storage regulator
MLVLSRKLGQKIVLPDLGVTIAVIRIAGGNVRIGIDAPAAIGVKREEICERTVDSGATLSAPRTRSDMP